MRKIFFAVILLAIGCTHLRTDPVMPAIDAEYPTVEFQVGERTFHGLGMAAVPRGTDLSSIGLLVKTYSSGTIRIDSKDCGIGISESYSDYQHIVVPLSGEANTSCVVSVVMSPRYSHPGAVIVYSLVGHFGIKVVEPGEAWRGFTRRVTGNFSEIIEINTGESSPVRAVLEGCGVSFDREITPDSNGRIQIDLADAVAFAPRSTCVLDGVVIGETYQDLLVNAIVSQYDKEFSPLPLPVIKEQSGKLLVEADDAVAVVGLDNEYAFKSSKTFKNYNPSTKHTLRLLTVKGRSVICKKNILWSCMQ